jgi:hypothetical protein
MIMDSRRHAAWFAAAGVHLVLVLCGAFRIPLIPRTHFAGAAIETYRDYTGAGTGYGFFAPGVASEWRATFEACSDPAHCAPIGDEPMGNEARLLLVTIDSMFAEEDLRDVVAASYAARELARLPAANVVLVKAGMYVIPPMEAYRRGKRPYWRTYYGWAFHRVAARQR